MQASLSIFKSLQCEPIKADLNCSNSSNRNSLCIRICPQSDEIESTRCQCTNESCIWVSKGKSCSEASAEVENKEKPQEIPQEKPQDGSVIQNIIEGVTFNVNGDNNNFRISL